MEAATLARGKSKDGEEALVSPKVDLKTQCCLCYCFCCCCRLLSSLILTASQFAVVVLGLALAVIVLWLMSRRRRKLFKGGDVAHLFEAVEVSMAVEASI
jgi:hypothetical protein